MSHSPNVTAPLRVSANGRYFVRADGQPFFWLGDTAWAMFGEYTCADAEAYLRKRAAQGFTVIQAVLAWGGGSGSEKEIPGANAAGERPWLVSPAQPNEAYFRHVDHLVRYSAAQGLVLAILPTWGYYVNQAKVFDVESAHSYGLWLGQRYQDQPNIVWVNGGDRAPTGAEEVWRALGLGLREGDGGAHLITYHPCGWRSSAQFWHHEPWLDFNMIETWTYWPSTYPAVLADTLLLPAKPVVLGEGAYEDGHFYPLGPITPLVVRRQAWWSFMAGGSYTYGHSLIWRMGPGWLAACDAPGAAHMAQFRAIASSRPWWKMIPDQSLFASGVSSERTLNTALRSVDHDCAMIYLSDQCHVLIYVDKILTRHVKATFVNPQDGTQLDAGIYATGNLTGSIFPSIQPQWFTTPPRWEDAVLILDGIP